ncbi:adenosylmethionine--8-amino-7-oxononanoate transaminase [Pandoraea pulmonicola]|uniref:Adenosylmethionine-8-amino-7-oxononanoate aminotransferase n=1 Tax=Pandoraea pulmonicola TaxID=93221 RepID=A0AAJ4ZCC8_PANPU|nr:adenosylmethionine--8-amino-7-oxononanoate transaminase [Pandoraea pulmonicola]AJC20794.1 adenosylmethionine--8-amino-7-oxononanoate transaminase [Pandoraea pulmonicola]SUA90671.1 Adenosylmethionine-8-amino-7-oxononanoate aminotransferase [Pandoraea pulmonicola]
MDAFPRPHAVGPGDLAARSLRQVWHPCTQMKQQAKLPLVALSHGEGPWLVDTDGERYLDAISSWWVNLFGHANPRINAALVDQLGRLEHAMLAGFTHEPVVSLSERLSALTGGVLGHAFFASDGASAVEIALKMSFHAWRNQGHGDKREFVCVRHGYHGETLGALAVTDVALFRDAYDPLLRHAHVVASPDARAARDGESAADVALRAAAELETLLARREGRVAAVIVEPLVQCAAGMAMHDPAYLRRVRELCDRYGAHMIADEIAVGCGRTGTFFASEQAGVWPDLLTLSKGISGGYLPLSLVLSRDAIYDAFYDDDTARGFLHSHSYTGNPLACRAALATLDIFADDDVLAGNIQRAARLTQALSPFGDDARVRHFRQRGMIWAFDAVLPDEAGAGRDFGKRFATEARARGVLLRPIGATVYLMPPYVLDDATIDWLATQTLAAFDATLPQRKGVAA